MNLIHLPFTAPAQILAADEVMLDRSEAGLGGETLLFWEPHHVFVVVGYANKVATEVNVAACKARGIPIFRRCSGGGTVIQMPGGLNYSLILRITEDGPTRNITTANQFIMEKNRAAVASLFSQGKAMDAQTVISVRGHTDLCYGDVKFAGNSQRRRKNFLLFHGTLLLNCELPLISELLPMPSLQPDYRDGRPHRDFVTNLNQSVASVKTALAKEWNATEEVDPLPLADIARVAREKYSAREWNFKF